MATMITVVLTLLVFVSLPLLIGCHLRSRRPVATRVPTRWAQEARQWWLVQEMKERLAGFCARTQCLSLTGGEFRDPIVEFNSEKNGIEIFCVERGGLVPHVLARVDVDLRRQASFTAYFNNERNNPQAFYDLEGTIDYVSRFIADWVNRKSAARLAMAS